MVNHNDAPPVFPQTRMILLGRSVMRIARVDIRNFRSLQSLSIPLSPFTCVVGQNNAGKSSWLTALSLFVNGSKISRPDFYDPAEEVSISVILEGVTVEALAFLGSEHRQRVAELVREETLTLV